jgi:hypothetical protein
VLPHAILDRLKTMRGPGESYSDVIMRLANAVRTSRIVWMNIQRSNGGIDWMLATGYRHAIVAIRYVGLV